MPEQEVLEQLDPHPSEQVSLHPEIQPVPQVPSQLDPEQVPPQALAHPKSQFS